MADLITKEVNTSKYLGDLETWIASPQGQRYSCTRQYPYPGYACDYHGATCVGCLIVAAACELRNKVPASETSELQRALHVIDEVGKLSDWINRARPVVTDLMAAYERRIRTDCTPEELTKEPWRCMEYIGAEGLLRDQPIAVVELTAQKADERRVSKFAGPPCTPPDPDTTAA